MATLRMTWARWSSFFGWLTWRSDFDILEIFQSWETKHQAIKHHQTIIKDHQTSSNIINEVFSKRVWNIGDLSQFAPFPEPLGPFKLNSCARMTGYHRPVPIMARCKLYPILGHTSHCSDSHDSQRTYRSNVSGLNKNSFPQKIIEPNYQIIYVFPSIATIFRMSVNGYFSPHLLNQSFDPRVFFGESWSRLVFHCRVCWNGPKRMDWQCLRRWGTWESNWFQISCWEVKGWKNICQNGINRHQRLFENPMFTLKKL